MYLCMYVRLISEYIYIFIPMCNSYMYINKDRECEMLCDDVEIHKMKFETEV